MTFGYSRKDISKFLQIYLDQGILQVDPFPGSRPGGRGGSLSRWPWKKDGLLVQTWKLGSVASREVTRPPWSLCTGSDWTMCRTSLSGFLLLGWQLLRPPSQRRRNNNVEEWFLKRENNGKRPQGCEVICHNEGLVLGSTFWADEVFRWFARYQLVGGGTLFVQHIVPYVMFRGFRMCGHIWTRHEVGSVACWKVQRFIICEKVEHEHSSVENNHLIIHSWRLRPNAAQAAL